MERVQYTTKIGGYIPVQNEFDPGTHVVMTKDEYGELMRWKAEAVRYSNLNTNLLRVARERANKDRNMDKHGAGYLIVSWQLLDKKTPGITNATFYQIIVQTPWDCSFKLSDVDNLMMRDVADGKIDIGADKWYGANLSLDDAIEGAYATMRKDLNESRLVVDRRYKSNVRAGLWEVTLITNFEPTIRPENRRKYV